MSNNRSRTELLDHEPIPQLLFSFSLPTITGMLVMASYNIIDRIFIGQGVGSVGIAAVTAGFPIMLIMMAFGQLVGIGGGSLTSIRLGQKRIEEAEVIMSKSFGTMIGISLMMMTLGQILLVPALRFFGVTDDILPYSVKFMRIILSVSLFNTITMGWNNFIRAQGDPKTAMITMMISAATNLLLAPLFILVFHWGITGAALATACAMGVSTCWVLSYFLKGKSALKVHWKLLIIKRSDLPLVFEIMSVGMAPFFMQLASVMVMSIYNHGVIHYAPLSGYPANLGLAAIGIVMATGAIVVMPMIGLNQGAQPIIGYSFGAKKYDRLKQTVILAMGAASVYALICWAVICHSPHAVASVFNSKDTQLISLASKALFYSFIALPVVGVQVVCSNYFQAMGKAKIATFLTLSRQLIFLIPCMLILPRYLGINGIFMSQPIADVLSALITVTVFLIDFKRLGRHDGRRIVEGASA